MLDQGLQPPGLTLGGLVGQDLIFAGLVFLLQLGAGLLGGSEAAAGGALQLLELPQRAVKLVLLAAGAVLLLLTGLEIGDVRALSPIQGFEFRVGSGLLVIAVGGVLLFVAALLDRVPWSLRSRP